jgi:hypothetical protein
LSQPHCCSSWTMPNMPKTIISATRIACKHTCQIVLH